MMSFEELEGELVLVVDDPDEEEAILLDGRHWQCVDQRISQGVVGDGNTSSWVSRGELPWRVHRDDVE